MRVALEDGVSGESHATTDKFSNNLKTLDIMFSNSFFVPATTYNKNAKSLLDLFNDVTAPIIDDYGTHFRLTPAINLAEDKGNYYIEIAVAGMTKEDFNITLGSANNIIIETKADKAETEKAENSKDEVVEAKIETPKKHYHQLGFKKMNFKVQYELPEDTDKDVINATVENGVLTITLPKKVKEEDHNINRAITIC